MQVSARGERQGRGSSKGVGGRKTIDWIGQVDEGWERGRRC